MRMAAFERHVNKVTTIRRDNRFLVGPIVERHRIAVTSVRVHRPNLEIAIDVRSHGEP